MSARGDLDPDMLVVLEIAEHAGEILSRLPLAALRAHLNAKILGPEPDKWTALAAAAVRAAEAFELANAELSAEDARGTYAPAPPIASVYPDDALPSQ